MDEYEYCVCSFASRKKKRKPGIMRNHPTMLIPATRMALGTRI
jgi:hypothetical protein